MAVTLWESTSVRVAFFLSLLALTSAEPNIDGLCETRDGIKGICMSIHLCPPAVEGLRRGSLPTSCGFIGFTPYVCCPQPVASTDLVVEANATTPLPLLVLEANATSPPPLLVLEANATSPPPLLVLEANATSPPPLAAALTSPIRNASTHANVSDNVVSAREGRGPGEAAKKSCENLAKICSERNQLPHFNFRFERDVRPTEMPDYDAMGTPMVETMTEPNDINKPTFYVPPLVVGGEKADEFEYPHMAAIGYGKDDNVRWECGGTLVSERFVLTAAHCLTSYTHGPAEWVQLGTNYLMDDLRSGEGRTRGQTHRILRRVRHPGYRSSSKYNDLALLEIGPALTSGAVLTSRRIHSACLETESDVNVGQALATGWGRIAAGDDPSPDLLKVTLSIINSSVCEKSYAVEMTTSKLRRGIDDSSMICAGELAGGKDTCQGDSGGPLQIQLDKNCLYKVIGVTSFGKICGFSNSPAVYMRVSHFIPWIESVVWPED